MELEGKVAAVTGGSRGIGRAIAKRLAESGCDLFLVALSEGNLESTAGEMAETGRHVETCATDLRTLPGCEAVRRSLNDTFGRVDILINCAGATKGGRFVETPDEQ